jgi:hypothetical protein
LAVEDISGIHLSGAEIPAEHEVFLYRLFRGYDRMFERNPKRVEEMFRLQLASIPAK